LLVLLGYRRKDKIVVKDIFIPPQRAGFGYCEVTDYSWAEKLARRIIGWAHLGGAHFHSAFHSGIDYSTDERCALLFDKPFASITISRFGYDCIVYTNNGPIPGRLYKRVWRRW